MSDFEERKREAAQTFGNIVRSSSASEALNAQQMMMVFTQLVSGLEEGGTLDLTPMEEFLKEQHQLEQAKIEEIFVFFQSREEKLGFPVALPASMASISEERRTLILEQFKKQPKGDTYSGTGRKPVSSPGKDPARPRTQFDQRRPEPTGPNRRLVAVALAVILGGGGFLVYSNANSAPPIVKVPIPKDPNALPCTELIIRGDYAACKIDRALFESYSSEERKSRHGSLLDSLAAKSVRTIRVLDDKTGAPLPL